MLPELQPRDAVHMKLDQQKGWKTSGVVIPKSSISRSYAIGTPQCIVLQNRSHLHPTTNPIKVEKFAELKPDMEPEEDLSPKSATTDMQELPPTVTQ